MEPSVNLNDQFNDLLRLESLDKIIDNDIFFYAAFFNHVSTKLVQYNYADYASYLRFNVSIVMIHI